MPKKNYNRDAILETAETARQIVYGLSNLLHSIGYFVRSFKRGY